MVNTIQVEYQALQLISRHFKDHHQRVEVLSHRLQQHIELLQNHGWWGPGATAFYAEMDTTLLPSLARLSQTLIAVDTAIHVIGQDFQIAEEEAQQLLGEQFGELDDVHQGAKTSPYNRSNNPAEIRDGTRTGVAHKTADIFYVNGILTDSAAHLKTLENIEAEFPGQRVAGIYNATEGLITDGVQAVGDRYGLEQNNRAVDSLVLAIQDRLQNPGTFEIIAHSQGAAITAEALRRLDAMHVALSRVKVTALGGFGINFPNSVDYHHYVHINDPVGLISVVADPKLVAHTTLMPNISSPAGSQIPVYNMLVAHSGEDYIRNPHSFRAWESATNSVNHQIYETVDGFVSTVQDSISSIGQFADQIF
ncbi:MAG: WXG100 family type VII secretion target [Anaerolineaceae bacterium]|nr:WXG100 family type VII secretion target [Anaerolineaceae bacterium]